ncbi:hypothetical protein Bca52824_058782 [Brassica carinata]|uniref:Uncharacterized protein n=1 Tax=Brassica carinata TaxID=52824 RepID=A0A8X7UEX4_BRACI|nr:hypothetical protein Bca52824_058782 [Brassica carinata]
MNLADQALSLSDFVLLVDRGVTTSWCGGGASRLCSVEMKTNLHCRFRRSYQPGPGRAEKERRQWLDLRVTGEHGGGLRTITSSVI